MVRPKSRKFNTTTEMRPGEIAEIFGVARSTISYWAVEGKLKFYSTPGGDRRFYRDSVIALMKKQGVPLSRLKEKVNMIPVENKISAIMKRIKDETVIGTRIAKSVQKIIEEELI